MTVDRPSFPRCKLSVDASSNEKSKFIANTDLAHEQQYAYPFIKSRKSNSAYSCSSRSSRNIGRFFIWWYDRRERKREEARKKPVLDVETPQAKSQYFILKCGEDTKPIAGRLIFTRIRPTTEAAAFGLKAGGTIIPPFEASDMMAFTWAPKGGSLRNEIEVQRRSFSTEVNALTLAEIGKIMRQQLLPVECDIASGIGTPLILGLTVIGVSYMFFGDELIKLPCEAKVGILVYSDTYGALGQEWFKVTIPSWDEIAFEHASRPS
jgi:hypothetical protein